MIKIVGIGPGNPDYILPIASKEIESAKFLVGGKRALKTFAREGQQTFPITSDIDSVIRFISEHNDNLCVLVSGDPGFYSLLDIIKSKFNDSEIEVIPGISSLQMAFAKINLPWHHATLLSFHGRTPGNGELEFEKNKILGILTDGVYHSKKIAEVLQDFNWEKNSKFIVFERLSYEDEKITKMTLDEARNAEPISHGVIIVF